MLASAKRLILCFLVAAFFLSSSKTATADIGEKKGRYVIHIMTIDPGEELFMRFGHIAVVVEDRRKRAKRVYNFGTYDFDDPELRWKYTQGFLTYWLSVVPYVDMVRWYKEDNRTATVRTLNLTEAQAEAVAKRLAVNARPENAEYDYRHYLDNCCTRIRDLLDDALGGAIKKAYANEETGRTFRYWTRRALRGFPIYKNIILFSLGPAIDQPVTRWQEQFLPEVLVEDLDEMTVGDDGEPLVSEKQQIFKSTAPKVGTTFYVEDAITAGLLFGLLILGFGAPLLVRRPGVGRRILGVGLLVWGLVAGLAGTMLVLYWTITTHYDTHYNENLLVMPPTHLLLLGLGLKLIIKARLCRRTVAVLKWYLIGSLGLIALDLLLKIGPFIQGNFEFIVFAALCDAGALFSLIRQFKLAMPAGKGFTIYKSNGMQCPPSVMSQL